MTALGGRPGLWIGREQLRQLIPVEYGRPPWQRDQPVVAAHQLRKLVTSAANSAWYWNRKPWAESGYIFSCACGISPASR
jgi:hypothetical protein